MLKSFFTFKMRFIMKRLFSTLFVLILSSHSFSDDQLPIDSSFTCPVENPLCFKYHNNNFYIIKSDEANIFIVNRSMKCIDTIATPLTKIDALAIHDDFLWVIPDSSISERVSYEQISEDTFDSLRYRSYYIYKINPDSGLIVDSVAFEVSAGGPADTNFILGLEVYNDEFIVAINGGFGPCVLFVELQKPHKVRSGCCSHPMGMVRIGNEIFAVRFGGKALTKFSADSETLPNSIDYTLSFIATDIAYDGHNIWLCELSNSMLHKMESLSPGSELFTTTKSRLRSVNYPNITKPVILNGRVSRYREKNASQIMILIQEDKTAKRSIIDCKKKVIKE